ncbi:MAG TPA: hypothetical protein VGF94_07385 [Kofleriaceae bacterium]|jgi:hypothetical protein
MRTYVLVLACSILGCGHVTVADRFDSVDLQLEGLRLKIDQLAAQQQASAGCRRDAPAPPRRAP